MAKGNIFISKYVMACAIAIVITLVGFICMKTLPIEQYPNIAPPQVSVVTDYTGADAATIMESVIQPLEESINGVPDMTYMTSKPLRRATCKSRCSSSKALTPTWLR